ncbi:hypothetical protein EZS27_023629 [termite gut metagenome]|uniref:Uncharacterized protein n=1 Tax=termite gut metagenome TaxID=433724 RepID=A0A5J4R248_9ZZZZ
MKNKDYEEIHYEISLIFSNLFKALPLPEDIIKEVIEALFH